VVKTKPPETAIKYVNFLPKGNPKIIKAYLFGSYAKGNDGPDSDQRDRSG
jgi:predicted nucleotidyltransferase